MRTASSERLKIGLAAIAALDLSNVCRKIQEPAPEGKGWSTEQTNEAEMWYRRYLELCLRYSDYPVVPNYPIDSMWHQHILDTRAYAKDCEAIFGDFLHHYPYFGLNGDANVRDNSFDRTNELYLKLFGEDCTSMRAFKVIDPTDASILSGKCANGCHPDLAILGSSCNHGGSGTGCGQGGRGGSADMVLVVTAASCGHGGSGTGCGQGGRGGRHIDFGHPSGQVLSGI